MILASVPELDAQFGMVFSAITILSVIVFALEYAARLWTVAGHTQRTASALSDRLSYVFSALGIIDLLAFLPAAIVLESDGAQNRGSATPIQAAQQATSIFAAVVRFEAGARNHWHSHSGGQLLHVIEGEGWVQVRGQEPERIRLHDTVAADPGEEHWHGAGGHSPMSHLAVAAGETRWLEESPPPPD